MASQFDVFLSHSSVDKPWVIKLKDDLIRYGVSVWLDKDEIRPGDLFAKALEDGIRDSKSVALIISPESMKSGWVEAEYYRAVTLATSGDLQLIPVLYKNAEIPNFLSDRSWVDFQDEIAYAQKLWELVWGITGEKPPEVHKLRSLDVSSGVPGQPESQAKTISGGFIEKSHRDILVSKDSIDPLAIEKKIKDIHVDRDEEIQFFRDMLEGRSDVHIFLIEAESGMGKSVLLEKFKEMSDEKQLPWAKVDFKNASYTFGEILREMCNQLSNISFIDFDNQCRNFIANSGLSVGRSALLSSSIDAAMADLLRGERNRQRLIIIDAFFGELAAFNERYQGLIVLTFDTFERASGNVKEWLTDQFIERCQLYPWVICVIAGQEAPGIDPTTEWCSHSKLEALSKEHIIEYLHHLKLTQEDVIVKFITSVIGRDPSELKSLGEDVLFDLFTGILTLNTKGKPADLQQIALSLATQDR